METSNRISITVETTVAQPVAKVWKLWTEPEHITHWNFASDDWHCPQAHNIPHAGEKFSWRMEAKDGSMGFDFSGTYEQVTPREHISYKMDDGRRAIIEFADQGQKTKVTETFEAEKTNPIDMQRQGWQAILNNFKRYAEKQGDG